MKHSAKDILELLNELDVKQAQDLESETLEFMAWEAEWSRNQKKFYRMLAEYAVCFANHKGGTLVLGVRERVKGRAQAITGCGPYNVNDIRSRIYDMTDPKILVEVEEIHVEDLGVRVLMIHIPMGVAAVHTTTDGVAKMRVGTQCKPMTGSVRIHRRIEAGEFDVTACVIDSLDINALDSMAIELLKNIIATHFPNSPLLNMRIRELLEHTGIIRNGAPTGAGILLIGKESFIRKHFPSHEIQYLRMKSESEYERRHIFHCGLLLALEDIYRNIELYNNITTVQVGLFRFEIKDFLEGTYREGILNAVLHRNYNASGAVFIKHYPDRLEISNPGGFLAGITPQNILRQDSYPRNRHLSEILRRIGLIEKAGMGVKRMFYNQLFSGKEPPHYWTNGESVRLTIFNGALDEHFVRFIREYEKKGTRLGLDELLVLFALRRRRELTLTETAGILQLEQYRCRKILLDMVRKGLLERSGVRKGQIYRLSAELYRKLGESVEYIRERGIDSMRFEELIMEFVRRHGRITNRQVRELLGVNIDTAKRLLSKLYNKGKLNRTGKGRSTYYELPD